MPEHLFWYFIGAYESSIFGLCFMVDHSDKFIDDSSDRYKLAKETTLT